LNLSSDKLVSKFVVSDFNLYRCAEGALFIAKALSGRQNADGRWVFNSSLRSLNLEFNSIGDEGLVAIAQALSPTWVAEDGSPLPSRDRASDHHLHPHLGNAGSAGGRCSAGRWVCNTVGLYKLNPDDP
jgi:hypothetical protein